MRCAVRTQEKAWIAAGCGLKRHADTITLLKELWTAPQQYAFGSGTLIPYRAGEPIAWRLAAP